MINSNVTTLTLNGAETAVEFEKGYPYYQITNKGDADIYVAMSPGIVPETEGVYTVSAGGSEIIGEGYAISKFYILGTGKVYIRGKLNAMSVSFKRRGKGGDVNTGYHGEFMPHMEGVTEYFDMSSVDITNKQWLNRVGNNNILFTDCLIEDNSLKIPKNHTGELICNEPSTIYAVVKTTRSPVDDTNQYVISKSMTQIILGTAFDISVAPPKSTIGLIGWSNEEGKHHVYSKVTAYDKYHVICITRSNTKLGILYIDGELSGTVNSDISFGNYQGKYLFNFKKIGNETRSPMLDCWFKMAAFSEEYHSPVMVIENSKYLASLLL